jgi:hypothetical protein
MSIHCYVAIAGSHIIAHGDSMNNLSLMCFTNVRKVVETAQPLGLQFAPRYSNQMCQYQCKVLRQSPAVTAVTKALRR